ncbi:Hypothetical predicted protein [Pelobates cultripes]|uniref:Uncharacterized protein n=1 Tax=Pelobates cultripes TaxID=61616 RepID=A0AAD1RNK6_PELCU|nr:Hypothetical predicted protein [Pelobates cultripes]
MAPSSPSTSSVTGSVTDMPGTDALAQMSVDLAAISANMLTRGDKTALVSELRTVIREEIAAVRRDLTALEQRVDELEEHRLHATHHQQAADLATARQGNILLEMRRQVEDLDNRGRRNNIRVRGLPESDDESPRELLTGLFVQLLGEDAPPEIPMERAHRALRGPRSDGQPRDMICCLTSFQQKDAIMRAARAQRSIAYMDSQVMLFQDLSSLTLDARRALKPLTTMLQEKRIPYKWGFPFSLQAKIDNRWHTLRWPNDVPRFLQSTGLPHVHVQNWILENPPARPTGPYPVAENLLGGRAAPPPRRRGGPDGPEE